MPLSAFDFHCSRVLSVALSQPSTFAALVALCPTGAGAVEALAKRAMWHCSSSLSPKAVWRGGAALDVRQTVEGGTGGYKSHVLAARRAAAEAAATAQAAADPGACSERRDGASGRTVTEPFWASEAQAAAAAMDVHEVGGATEAEVLRRAWAILAPACRRFACEELRTLLANEERQRRPQQQTLRAMPPALLLRAPPASLSAALPMPHPELSGLYLIPDFVSAEEEAALLQWVDAAEWRSASATAPSAEWHVSHWNAPGAGNEGKNWGANTRSASGRLEATRFEPLPPPLLAVAERMAAVAPAQLEGGTWRPNQANAISYTKAKGHYLGGHCDDRQVSSDPPAHHASTRALAATPWTALHTSASPASHSPSYTPLPFTLSLLVSWLRDKTRTRGSCGGSCRG